MGLYLVTSYALVEADSSLDARQLVREACAELAVRIAVSAVDAEPHWREMTEIPSNDGTTWLPFEKPRTREPAAA